MSAETRASFIRRFDRVWQQARRVQFWKAGCWSLLMALAGLALLAAVDYTLELARPWRVAAVGAIAAAALGVAVFLALRSLRRWQRNATASAIEHVFPQLGQRIRTTVEFGELSPGEIEAAGTTGTLVAALEEDTVHRAQPLPLDAVVPWKSLALASLLAAGVGLFLAGASAFDWQWRIAVQRALLGDEPFTRLAVEPGNTAVKEGESLSVQVAVEGRIGETLSFETRPLEGDDREWREEIVPATSGKDAGLRRLSFDLPLDRLRHPLEYRVSAGSATSDTYRVDVRYPLKIVKLRAAIQPPAYTGLGETVVEGGDITALVGSRVRLSIELDQQPRHATLEMQDLDRRRDEAPAPQRLPPAINGKELSTEFEVTGDKTFRVVAMSPDGMQVAENKHRLRARPDEAPQVWFENPPESLEVHTLAEILMKVRASDDFGLSRAGIMFEVNNEEEYPLVAEDFRAVAEALTEGAATPQTRATLEKVLPLEHFALTQQDSVMYYAFAEDIRPNSPQRTETELKFIDIRPFKRQYRLIDPEEGMGAQGPQLKSLEELIGRQRYALNRAIRMARTFERTGEADLSAVDSLTKFEAGLAQSTRELADGLEAIGVDETELLYQAEAAMLAATDSISAGKYDTAALQMRDALKDLIEGRNRIQIYILKNPNRSQLAALRAFDRMQRQKLRRPKTDEEEARQIVERLQELADQEESVYASLEGGGEADAPSDDELDDRQLDIAVEARDVEKALANSKIATDLAKTRMAAAAQSAEAAAESLGQGKTVDAKQPAGEAKDQFRELAEQMAALAAQEQADRIAAAQQMAADLARRQQTLRDQLSQSQPGGASSSAARGKSQPDQPPMPADGQGELPGTPEGVREAERIAGQAQTLADVLTVAAKADSPADRASAEQVEELMRTLALEPLVERLATLPEHVRAGQREDAKTMAGDGAERMEVAAERLGALRRSIVAPQVDELARLEERLAGLDERLDSLDTEQDLGQWHGEADDVLDRLDEAGVDDALRNELIDEMRAGGWSRERRPAWTWARSGGGTFVAPRRYRMLLSRLSASLRTQLQELMLGDLTAGADEPVPPQYQELVDRYYQVLATKRRPASE